MIVKGLTVEETAEQLKTTARTIRRWITEERLPAVKVGKRWLITQDTINSILLGDISVNSKNED